MKNPEPSLPLLLEVRTAKGNKLIRTSDILFIESKNKHSLVYLNGQSTFIETHALLKWYESRLPEPQFCRCHGSFIVNCHYIDCYLENRFIIKENRSVPISRKRKAKSKTTLKNFLLMPV